MIVLLHPFPFDSRVFVGLGTHLDGELLTPDLQPLGEPSLDVLADQVGVALDAAGVERAVIGGVSMGGYVALNLLERHPEWVDGIVLIDTKATADAAPALRNRAVMAADADRNVRPAARDLLPGMLSPVTFEGRPELVAELAAIIDDQPIASIGWLQRAMATRPDRTAMLAATGVPVLVIVGSDDAITPPEASAAMAAAAGGELVEIPEAGHLAVAEQPAEVAAAINRWTAHTTH